MNKIDQRTNKVFINVQWTQINVDKYHLFVNNFVIHEYLESLILYHFTAFI